MEPLEYRRGKPDKPGYWWLWPDEKFVKQTGLNFGWSRIVEVRTQNDVIPNKPELYM